MGQEAGESRLGRSVPLTKAAELLGISLRTVYLRIKDGTLETVRTPNRSQRVLMSSIDAQKKE
jgi:excisionase family DNA binding protein